RGATAWWRARAGRGKAVAPRRPSARDGAGGEARGEVRAHDGERALGALERDVARLDDERGDPLDLAPLGARGDGDRASVQGHVPALNADGGERADGGQVRGEADRGGDRAELLRRAYVHHAQGEARGRVHAQRAADGAERHGHLERALEQDGAR